MLRAVVTAPLALMCLVLVPPAAAADGLPVPVDGANPASVVAPNGDGPRYATVDAGEDTQLLRIDREGGEITAARRIDGEFSVPLVAIDGSPSGLSADGETLALINPRTRFPRRESTFVIVDVGANGGLRPREPFTLEGDFSFDALSPDGRIMFLVEYTSRDYNDYAVREYDLARERLLPDPVLVAHEVSPDEMRGLPLTRATSPDGVWEYTLYNGGGRAQRYGVHPHTRHRARHLALRRPAHGERERGLAGRPGADRRRRDAERDARRRDPRDARHTDVRPHRAPRP